MPGLERLSTQVTNQTAYTYNAMHGAYIMRTAIHIHVHAMDGIIIIIIWEASKASKYLQFFILHPDDLNIWFRIRENGSSELLLPTLARKSINVSAAESNKKKTSYKEKQ